MNVISDNRLVRVQITPELLVSLFVQDNHIHAKVIKGLPETAKYQYGWMDDETSVINLIVQDDSFEPLEPGQDIPYFTPTFQSLYVEPCQCQPAPVTTSS